MKETAASLLSVEEVVKKWSTHIINGLSFPEATHRLKISGSNEIKVRELHGWDIFLRQFTSPFIYLLLFASTLTFFLGEKVDTIMILLFVAINATLGFLQEYRSEKAIRLLRNFIIGRSKVIRNGQIQLIPTSHIVPGDIILLYPGDKIPADIRMVEVQNITVDESILTGESIPIVKQTQPLVGDIDIYSARNMGFSGTSVISGMGKAIVVATGRQSAVGEIAFLTSQVTRISSFEKSLRKFSTFILRLIGATLLLVVIANLLLKGQTTNLAELLIFSIALAVSVIPEALPVVTTFSLSRGALRLAKNMVVVKRLSAIEDLGSIEILATDKTGTLTENELTVSHVLGDNQTVLFNLLLSRELNGNKVGRNPFDFAAEQQISPENRKKLTHYRPIQYFPFDPDRRRSSSLVDREGEKELIVRGAADTIVPACINVNTADKQNISHFIKDEGRLGKRVIAVAKKILQPNRPVNKLSVTEESSNLTFLGLVSFIDPIKKSAFEAIRKARNLGITIKILTGDAPEVAGNVAYEIGLIPSSKEVITGSDFEKMDTEAKHRAVKNYSVFARVNPTQKYNIVSLLREKSEIGFLGEGLNDAPALKIAHVGLVVNDAADIAREAADIVLLRKSLEVIIDGIEEGRLVFANTMKYVKATLTSNFGNFYAVAIASLLIDFLPMLPLQILLVNLLSDFPMIAIAADTVDSEELTRPRSYDVKDIAIVSTILGIVSSFFDFLFFAVFVRFGQATLQTNWFVASILTELVLLFSIRTQRPFFKAKPASIVLVSLTVVAFITTLVLPYVAIGQSLFRFRPPTTNHLLLILVVVGVYFIVTEGVKLLYYRVYATRSTDRLQ